MYVGDMCVYDGDMCVYDKDMSVYLYVMCVCDLFCIKTYFLMMCVYMLM